MEASISRVYCPFPSCFPLGLPHLVSLVFYFFVVSSPVYLDLFGIKYFIIVASGIWKIDFSPIYGTWLREGSRERAPKMEAAEHGGLQLEKTSIYPADELQLELVMNSLHPKSMFGISSLHSEYRVCTL